MMGSGPTRCVVHPTEEVGAYIAFAQHTGVTVVDCLTIARLLFERRRSADALTWVERGLVIERTGGHESTSGYDLRRLKSKLLAKFGRANEALEAAWLEFREHRSMYSYDDVMTYVPRAARSSWHAKAIAAARASDRDTNLEFVIELVTETNELE